MVSSLLAGLVVLVIGDSHLATPGYLITTLHDELTQGGAQVYSYGACGMNAGDWVKATKFSSPSCNAASREGKGPIKVVAGAKASTVAYADLVAQVKPDLVVVVIGDTMAGYMQDSLPKTWVWQQVSRLTKVIKTSEKRCVWVGPAWGSEGGKYGKTYARAQEMSNALGEMVAPCTYINSLEFSKKGEWPTIDGQHFNAVGYKKWGQSIAQAIAKPEIAGSIKK
jgi:hypothetical protein